MTYDLLCIGETMVMLAPQPVGPLRDTSLLQVDIAGAESNVASSLAALGMRCAFVSRVGADPFGDVIISRLRDRGVDCIIDTMPSHPTGVYFKDPNPAGTRVYYYRSGSAASTMDFDLVVPEANLIHLTGITPALSPGCARLVRLILDQRPRQVSFDVNFRAGLWSVAEAAPVLADLANRAAVVFVGRDEAAVLWGTDTCDDIRDLLPEPAILVVKDAAAEAVSFGPAGRVAVPAPKVDVVEPVGAGDAFAAGYLFGLLGSLDEPVRLSLGHLVAAAALGSTSDHGRPPDPTELLALAHQHVEATRGKPR